MTNSSNIVLLALGIVIVVGVLISFAAITLLHMLPTGYDPIKQAISDYGVGKYRFWYHFEVITLALVGIALAIASTGNSRPEPLRVVAFLIAFSVARSLLIFFPTDIEGQPPTRTGRIHLLLAFISFGSVATAAGMFHGTALDTHLGWVVIGTVALLLVGLIWSRFRPLPLFGLLERLFYCAMISWFLVVGTELIRLAL